MIGQPVGHCCHHGCPLATAVLRTEEPDVAVGHQAPHGLVKTLGETAVTDVGKRWVSTVRVNGTNGWGSSSPPQPK